MKTYQELMLEFMVAMSPALADYVLNNEELSVQAAVTEITSLARELTKSYLENT
jgi:hypothetical protein